MNSRLWLASLVLCVAVAGCGTKERKGDVGEQLEGGSVRATVTKFSSEVPGPRPDEGRTRFAAQVEMCKDSGQLVNASAFALAVEDGDGIEPVYRQPAYSDGFGTLRDGCEGGWLVFDAPAGARPRAVTFEYEDTGQGGPGGDDGEKLAFEWAVP